MTEQCGTSIATLLGDPARAAGLTCEEAAALFARLAAVQSALATRLAAGPTIAPARASEPAPDRLLSPAEAAALLGVPIRWLYRNKRKLGVLRLSRKVIRFPEAELRRCLRKLRLEATAQL
jgi:hypothetical protein